MPLPTRIFIFLLGLFPLVFLSYGPNLLDSTLVMRFILSTTWIAFGSLLLLPAIPKITFSWLDVLLFGFYLINLTSITWAHNFGEGIFTSQKYFLLASACFLLQNSLHVAPESTRRQLQYALLSCAFIAISFVFYQVYSANSLAGNALYAIDGHSGHKNLAASYAFMLCGILGALYYSSKQQILVFLAMLTLFIAMVLLRSRAIYLALFTLGVVISIAFLWQSEYRTLLFKRLLPATVGLIVLGGIVVFSSGAGSSYLKYLNPSEYAQSESALERRFIWYKTKLLIKDKPITGHGVGSWKIMLPSKSIGGGHRLQSEDVVFTRVHNDFLEIWAETGLLGLLFWVAALGYGVYSILRRFLRAESGNRWEPIWLLGTLLGFSWALLLDFPKERIEHLLALALLLALSTSGGNRFALSKPLRLLTYGLLLVGLLINVPVGYYQYQGHKASRMILGLYRKPASHNQTLRFIKEGTSDWYNIDPTVMPMPYFEGFINFQRGQYNLAERAFAASYEINPYHFHVVNNYGTTLVKLNRFAEAIPFFQEALFINPKYEDGMFNLAYAYMKTNQPQMAREWVEKTSGYEQRKAAFLREIEQIESTTD